MCGKNTEIVLAVLLAMIPIVMLVYHLILLQIDYAGNAGGAIKATSN